MMAKNISRIVEFRVPDEIYERATKKAKNRGYKSAGLYTKQLLFASLESEEKETVSESNLTELWDEIYRLRESIDTEQKQQRKFREYVSNTFVAVLKKIHELFQNQVHSHR